MECVIAYLYDKGRMERNGKKLKLFNKECIIYRVLSDMYYEHDINIYFLNVSYGRCWCIMTLRSKNISAWKTSVITWSLPRQSTDLHCCIITGSLMYKTDYSNSIFCISLNAELRIWQRNTSQTKAHESAFWTAPKTVACHFPTPANCMKLLWESVIQSAHKKVVSKMCEVPNIIVGQKAKVSLLLGEADTIFYTFIPCHAYCIWRKYFSNQRETANY